MLFNDEWVRPEEAKLREVASLYAKTQQEDLRVSTDEEYTQMGGEKRISNGTNREAVIRARGVFNDQNVLRKGGGDSSEGRGVGRRGKARRAATGVGD